MGEEDYKASPYSGFEDDGEDVAVDKRKAKEQKVNMLELMLGQNANYCPVISRNTIVNKAYRPNAHLLDILMQQTELKRTICDVACQNQAFVTEIGC